MKYKESNLDQRLKKWFTNDNGHQLLRSISLKQGTVRGLSPFTINLNFPITVIAGKNGSGKSTILALSCCAFHNISKGFKLANRKQAYYTFADFLVQHSEDVPPSGIIATYSIAHNNWRKSKDCPDGIGVFFQTRKKRKAEDGMIMLQE